MQIYLSFKTKPKLSYKTYTDIKPISTFDEAAYLNYNNYVNFLSYAERKSPLKVNEDIYFLNEEGYEQTSFGLINRTYLLKLFVEKLNDIEFISNSIKEFGLIKKQNFSDNQKYEIEVLNIANLIKIKSSEDLALNSYIWKIEFETNDVEKWKKFLIFLEDATNQKIKVFLNDIFTQSISNQKQITLFEIEDLKTAETDPKKDSLKKFQINQKSIAYKNLNRLENIFKDTPVVSSNKFYAAKILNETTIFNFENDNLPSRTKMLFIAAIIGMIVGLFFIIILNKIRKN